ncbi:hypothetical protein FDUTEX481_00588 [Tolypothrix sp. PCC 7601]|nr:hypothetical protein FDUTEX481_00588 [Tolypothrix sp. PCC 7601]
MLTNDKAQSLSGGFLRSELCKRGQVTNATPCQLCLIALPFDILTDVERR